MASCMFLASSKRDCIVGVSGLLLTVLFADIKCLLTAISEVSGSSSGGVDRGVLGRLLPGFTAGVWAT
jgi:hypothetical protein